MQYNEEMEQEVLRLEALKRANDAGHPEWLNACAVCHYGRSQLAGKCFPPTGKYSLTEPASPRYTGLRFQVFLFLERSLAV